MRLPRRSVWRNCCQGHVQGRNKDRTAVLVCCMGEASISFCHVAGVRDAAVLIFLLVIWAPLFKQVKTSVLLAPISKGCRLIEAKVYRRDGNMLPFFCFTVGSHCYNQHGGGWPNFLFQRLSPWVMGK